MSPVEVWSNSEDESPEHDSGSHEQHQLELEQQQFRQSRRLQMDTMQDIICDDTDRYVCVKSDENNGGGNHNNNNSSHISNNNSGLTSSSSACSSNNGNGGSNNGGLPMDKDEKRMRREIANSNERRRMQSINAGFQSLRQMLPHHEGEKLSKAAILQQTAEYIYSLEQEKTRLLSQNCHLKRLLDQQDHNGGTPDTGTPPVSQTQTQIVAGGTTTTTQIPVGGGVGVAPQSGGVVTGGTTTLVATTVAKKRKMDSVPVSDSSDEGLGSMSPEPVTLRTNGGLTPAPTPTTTITATNNPTVTGTIGNSNTTTSSNGRQCTTVNFSAKDFLELKHQLEVERRQRSSVEDKLKSLERQLAYPVAATARLHQFHPDGPELVVSSDCISEQPVPPAAEEVAISIIHKSIIATSGGKVGRVGPTTAPELVDVGSTGGAVQVIALESSGGVLGAKKHQLLLATDDRLEEAIVVPGATKQLLIPLKDEQQQQQQQQVYIKRARSRSPSGETTTTTTVVARPPKKQRYASLLEAAIKAEPKVEVERISSPSSIVVNEEHMMVTTTGAHLVGAGPKLTTTVQQQQQPPRLNTCRHNLETIVEAIRHLEGDAFDAVVPTQQQQQQQHQHPPALQPLQPPQPHSTTSSTPAAAQQSQTIGGGHRPMQEVPLALTTSSKQQQQQAIQSKHDRDHRQSQLEPYLKFRTGGGLPTIPTVVATANSNLPNAGSGSGVVTVAPPAASSIISVSLASAATAATTIVANGTAVASPANTVPLPAATLHHPHLAPAATAAQILQQQQQCRPGVIVVKQNT
ncbi:formin-J [Anopheles bellator]|uniref:formin-J n=1 Tax=Anopheles bellator TaxID=139047 RepID=UPI002647D824|nr:formin-J [Anopheles bellator]